MEAQLPPPPLHSLLSAVQKPGGCSWGAGGCSGCCCVHLWQRHGRNK